MVGELGLWLSNEGNKLRVFENKCWGEYLGVKQKKVTEDWRNAHNEGIVRDM
jgi:hypothetical protein